MSPDRISKILFITYPDPGQSDIVLAITTALLTRLREPEETKLQVHIASWPELGSRVQELVNRLNSSAVSSPTLPRFHPIPTPITSEVGLRNYACITHPPGALGAVHGFKLAAGFLLGYSASDYIRTVNDCLTIIEEVKPCVVIVDPNFYPAVDAAELGGVKTVVLWANCVRDVVAHVQGLWRLTCIFGV
jgi:hypothetical protein